MGFLPMTEIHGESSVWTTSKDMKRSMELMLMLSVNDTIDQMAVTISVCWYIYVLRTEDSHVLSRALDFEFKGQWKKGRRKRRWRKQVEE